MSRRHRCAAMLVLAIALGACNYNSVEPTPTPSKDDGLTRPQRRLAELAGLAAVAAYDATYALRAASGETGTVRIVARPPDYRVDVTLRGGEPSIFIQRAGSVVSCSTKARRVSCFTVARPGEPVPELFDPGVQRLFSDAVRELAASPASYVVTDAAAPASPNGAECFDVRRQAPSGSATAAAAPTADPTGFETGQYCFGTDGLLTRVAVTTGTLDLATRGPVPGPDAFAPPATPRALPALPSPSAQS